MLTLITSWSYAAGNGNLTDIMLLVGGLLLLPSWLAWTAALTSTGYPAEATTRAHSRSASRAADGCS